MRKSYLDYAEPGGHRRRGFPQINLITYSVLGNKHAWLFLGAFVAGQAIQLLLQEISSGLSQYYQTRFCLAFGFMIAVILFIGMLVDARTRPEKETKHEDKAD